MKMVKILYYWSLRLALPSSKISQWTFWIQLLKISKQVPLWKLHLEETNLVYMINMAVEIMTEWEVLVRSQGLKSLLILLMFWQYKTWAWDTLKHRLLMPFNRIEMISIEQLIIFSTKLLRFNRRCLVHLALVMMIMNIKQLFNKVSNS